MEDTLLPVEGSILAPITFRRSSKKVSPAAMGRFYHYHSWSNTYSASRLLRDPQSHISNLHLIRRVYWRPWDGIDFPEEYSCTMKLNSTRLLLDGLMGRFTFLGDKVTRQDLPGGKAIQPVPPLLIMQMLEKLDAEEEKLLFEGVPCENFIAEI
ncbi:hypothetical protein M9H77_35321 [Catharanthus roseus]|uniref:Uncharacterized protein n=1 Tax=Catharanthus roseus TaxID=4058 RepID=A0ACB9ZR92_CATRO|nr:hypothetical protein M9H77_35321 [Catharanthus roseus]